MSTVQQEESLQHGELDEHISCAGCKKQIAALREHYRPVFDLAFDNHGRHRGFDNCYDWLDSLLAKAKTLDHLEKLRNLGWMVAVHNDYKLPPKNGTKQVFTFWLFTHPHTGRFVKGEGETDLVAVTQALTSVLEQI